MFDSINAKQEKKGGILVTTSSKSANNLSCLIRLDQEEESGEVPIHNGYNSCSKCSCPGFVGGSGVYSCQRSGCGHHYNDHW